ncbi:MAG: TonB-dependent receptor plug domain-containing protein [Chitinophagaceae bacterium]|nr:TonB-dependent receptor plug domain-containing protein [Chitinophagaceae bacterium]
MLLTTICNRYRFVIKIMQGNRFLTKTTGDVSGNTAENLSVATKTLRIMQFSAVFILGLCLQVAAAGHAQKMTFSGKDVSLNKIFAEVKKQTGFKTIYDRNLVNDQTVSISAEDIPLQEFLDKVLIPLSMNYVIENKTIFVREKIAPNLNQKLDGTLDNPPITGIIRDAEGNPLSGVNIVLKRTKRGVTTDANGRFSIEMGINEILVISSVGFNSREIRLDNFNAPLIVVLEKNVSPLDEVVINKGYYTEKQRYSVSNVGKVTSEEIRKQPVGNPLLALQGRVPGLFITQANGLPGGGVTVRIQGQNSIAKGSDPLYVIDGVPYISQLLPNYGSVLGTSGAFITGNPMSFINPADIESIEVLKDADATAIYGSRAANGAILITTKNGKVGQVKANLNVQTGLGKVSNKLPLLNLKEYLQMRYEALRNDALIPSSDPIASDPYIYAPDLTIWDTTHETD